MIDRHIKPATLERIATQLAESKPHLADLIDMTFDVNDEWAAAGMPTLRIVGTAKILIDRLERRGVDGGVIAPLYEMCA